MDWRTVRFDWNRARAFLVTAEEGSLSAAARALGMTQPTVGRQVDALEQELGLSLFDRVSKRLVLTESGVDLLEHVRAMGDAARRMSMTASGQSKVLEGSICITASEMFAAYVLPPILAKLREMAPGIDVEVVASNAPQDLTRREADIAIRNFRPVEPDLYARKIRDLSGRFYAATQYLEQLGRPKTAKALSVANFISFDRTTAMLDLLSTHGFELTQQSFVYVSESHYVQWQLVRQGLGIGVQAEIIAAKDPLVEPALADLEPVTFPVWLVSHRDLHSSRRVRMVFDLLAEELAAL